MRNPMLSAPQNMNPRIPPRSPYLKAKEEWDNRIGATVVQAKNWRIVSLCSLLMSFLLTGF